MGRDLNGNELGKGIHQNKDGRYIYRATIDGKRQTVTSKTLDDLYIRIEKRFHLSQRKVEKQQKADRIFSIIQAHFTNDTKNYLGVYLITDGEFVKIGVAGNVNTRMHDLQIGNPKKLCIILYEKIKNAYKIEKLLHEKYKDKRMVGEWFDILDEVKEIKSINELIGDDINDK